MTPLNPNNARVTFTYDTGNQSRIVEALGCGYPVNMTYDTGPLKPEEMDPQPIIVEGKDAKNQPKTG